jgi:hypothetical protein
MYLKLYQLQQYTKHALVSPESFSRQCLDILCSGVSAGYASSARRVVPEHASTFRGRYTTNVAITNMCVQHSAVCVACSSLHVALLLSYTFL